MNDPIKELVNVHTGEVDKYYVKECDPGTSYAHTRAWRLCDLTRAGVPDRRVGGAVVVRAGRYGAHGSLAPLDPVRESTAAVLREKVRAAQASLEKAKSELLALYVEPAA